MLPEYCRNVFPVELFSNSFTIFVQQISKYEKDLQGQLMNSVQHPQIVSLECVLQTLNSNGTVHTFKEVLH